MTAFLYRMPAGIPGNLTRENQATVESGLLDSTATFPGFGLPGKVSSGKFVPITTGDAAAAVFGFLVRPFPIQGAPAITDNLGAATPPTSGIANVLKRGYINVTLNGSTAAAKGGTVYVRVAAAATGKPIGGIEAASDSTNTIALTNAYFTGPADASGNTEIAFNI